MLVTIGKIGRTVDVDVTRFSGEVSNFVFEYGLKQLLNDCHSDVTVKSHPDASKREAAVMAAVNEKLSSLYEGRLRSSGGRAADPILSLARKLAELDIKEAMRQRGLKASDYSPKMAAALVEANRGTKDPRKTDYIAKARASKELASAAAIDLATLGL